MRATQKMKVSSGKKISFKNNKIFSTTLLKPRITRLSIRGPHHLALLPNTANTSFNNNYPVTHLQCFEFLTTHKKPHTMEIRFASFECNYRAHNYKFC